MRVIGPNKIIDSIYEGHFPGRDGVMVEIEFENSEYAYGDHIMDKEGDTHLFVKEVFGNKVKVLLITNDKNTWIPMYKLEPEFEYYLLTI